MDDCRYVFVTTFNDNGDGVLGSATSVTDLYGDGGPGNVAECGLPFFVGQIDIFFDDHRGARAFGRCRGGPYARGTYRRLDVILPEDEALVYNFSLASGIWTKKTLLRPITTRLSREQF